jgi:hypothetical protein
MLNGSFIFHTTLVLVALQYILYPLSISLLNSQHLHVPIGGNKCETPAVPNLARTEKGL